MALLRILEVAALEGFRLRLRLSDGSVIERDVSKLLSGPVFDAIRNDRSLFREVRAEAGTVVWPNGADLCPDMVIWNGPPPRDGSARTSEQTSPHMDER